MRFSMYMVKVRIFALIMAMVLISFHNALLPFQGWDFVSWPGF